MSFAISFLFGFCLMSLARPAYESGHHTAAIVYGVLIAVLYFTRLILAWRE